MERARVLIADSSLFIRTMLKSQLESMGCDVVGTAKNGNEAGIKCQETQHDVVLMDIMIAEANDFALVRDLQKGEHTSHVIVMIPDEPGFQTLTVSAVMAGASGYIMKPVSPQDLKLRINGTLSKRTNAMGKGDTGLDYSI